MTGGGAATASAKCDACGKAAEGPCVLVRGKQFHPACLTCDWCRAKLDGKRLFFQEKLTLCEGCNDKCEASAKAPECAKCKQRIPDGTAFRHTPGGLAYHQDCFSCDGCSTLLQRSYFTRGGGLYCKPCMGKSPDPSSKTCKACSKVIGRGERFVSTSGGEIFHKTCFACTSCSAPISGRYVIGPKGPCCLACSDKVSGVAAGAGSGNAQDGSEDFKEEAAPMNRTKSTAARAPHFHHTGAADDASDHWVKTCKRCKHNVEGGDYVTTANAERYHKACFVCDGCERPLPGTYFEEADGKLCSECMDNKELSCAKCKAHISVGEPYFQTTDSEYFHDKCFSCSKCGISLSDGRFFPGSDGICCPKCRPPKQCAGCQSPIGRGEKHIATDDEQYYHKGCFVCCSCAGQLSGSYFARPEGIFCSPCLEKKRGTDTRRFTRQMSTYHAGANEESLDNDAAEVANGKSAAASGGDQGDSAEVKRCGECQEQIKPGEPLLTTGEGILYHNRCFHCHGCKEHLPDAYCMVENQRLCKKCAEKADEASAKECAECGQKIKRGQQAVTIANGEVFHCDCFKCHSCKSVLAEYFTRPEGKYCKACINKGKEKELAAAGEKDKRACTSCNKPITSREAFMSTPDGFYHRRCLVCSECRILLPGGFFGGNRCQFCFSKANIERPELRPPPPARPRIGSSQSQRGGADSAAGGGGGSSSLGPSDNSAAGGAPSSAAATNAASKASLGAGGGDRGAKAAPSSAPAPAAGSATAPGASGGAAEAALETCAGCKAALDNFCFTRPDGKFCRSCVDKVREKREKSKTIELTCAQCQKKVTEQERYMKTADGLIMHKHCFRCCQCKEQLTGAFFTGPDGMYCKVCMEASEKAKALHCAECSGEIARGEKYVTTGLGEKFHEKCLICTGCGMRVGTKFFPRSDGRFCLACQEDAQKAKECQACKHGIRHSESFVVNICGEAMHSDCYLCHICKEKIRSAHLPHFQAGICAKCEESASSAQPCHKCAKDVLPSEPSAAATTGRLLHRACSTCHLCREPVGGARSSVAELCKHRWAPRAAGGGGASSSSGPECSLCTKLVGEGEEYLEAPDGKAFHLGCFRCSGCQDRISGAFHPRQLGPLCLRCVQREDTGQSCSKCVRRGNKKASDGANLCQGCRLSLDGKVLTVCGLSYHQGCFLCSQCYKPMTGNFYKRGEHLVCKACK